jgi:hypothetical protein
MKVVAVQLVLRLPPVPDGEDHQTPAHHRRRVSRATCVQFSTTKEERRRALSEQHGSRCHRAARLTPPRSAPARYDQVRRLRSLMCWRTTDRVPVKAKEQADRLWEVQLERARSRDIGDEDQSGGVDERWARRGPYHKSGKRRSGAGDFAPRVVHGRRRCCRRGPSFVDFWKILASIYREVVLHSFADVFFPALFLTV